MKSELKIIGNVFIKLNGKIIRQPHNAITVLGKTHIADMLTYMPSEKQLPSEKAMANMAIGTGTPSTTALGTEKARKALKAKIHSNAIITFTAHWDIDDQVSGNITEAGIFNSPVLGGTMLCSVSFTAINKGVNDSLDITWTLTIT